MYDSCSCDGDPATFCTIKTVKARKTYECYECSGPISPGESHEYVFGKWDDVQEFRICALCLELRQWAQISVPCFCWNYGEMSENIRDMVTEVRRDVPAGFVFEWGRRIIKIKRHRYGQHWPMKFERSRKRTAVAIANEMRV